MLSNINEFLLAAKAIEPIEKTLPAWNKQISFPATISRAERNKRKKREKMKKHSRVINRH